MEYIRDVICNFYRIKETKDAGFFRILRSSSSWWSPPLTRYMNISIHQTFLSNEWGNENKIFWENRMWVTIKSPLVNHHLNLTPVLYVDQPYYPHEILLMLDDRRDSCPSGRRFCPLVSGVCSRLPFVVVGPKWNRRNYIYCKIML